MVFHVQAIEKVAHLYLGPRSCSWDFFFGYHLVKSKWRHTTSPQTGVWNIVIWPHEKQQRCLIFIGDEWLRTRAPSSCQHTPSCILNFQTNSVSLCFFQAWFCLPIFFWLLHFRQVFFVRIFFQKFQSIEIIQVSTNSTTCWGALCRILLHFFVGRTSWKIP